MTYETLYSSYLSRKVHILLLFQLAFGGLNIDHLSIQTSIEGSNGSSSRDFPQARYYAKKDIKGLAASVP